MSNARKEFAARPKGVAMEQHGVKAAFLTASINHNEQKAFDCGRGNNKNKKEKSTKKTCFQLIKSKAHTISSEPWTAYVHTVLYCHRFGFNQDMIRTEAPMFELCNNLLGTGLTNKFAIQQLFIS